MGDCKGCGLCNRACPLTGIPAQTISEKRVNPGQPAVFSSRCIRCLRCAEACPQKAIDLVGQINGARLSKHEVAAG
ncbi:MAG: 4Fe-4S dicluster domain-containing protein [bacterium]